MIEEFQRQTIYERVSEAGWRISPFDDKLGPKNKLSETWKLESEWSPVGKVVYISFALDPVDAGKVFEISAASEPPKDAYFSGAACQMAVKNKWEADLPGFIECLAKLRNL